MKSLFRRAGLPLPVIAAAAFLVLGVGTAAGDSEDEGKSEQAIEAATSQSGVAELRDLDLGHFITECPQAGRNLDQKPKPLDKRVKDEVEQSIARRSDDLRANQDYSCFPQDETSIDVNPKNDQSLVAGANDYRLGTASSGFYASTDGGKNWYDGIIPWPSAPASQSRGEGFIPSGGDPAIAFDRAGIVYYAEIGFFRGDDTNGVFVSRSTNGGFTWSRGCVPIPAAGGTFVCGGTGDPRQPGDGVVTFNPDNDLLLNGSVPFNDKEYIATGPRPDGVGPQCFTPTHAPTPCEEPRAIGVDRIYVTWTKFGQATGNFSRITVSYSDDQGRSWSPEMTISGSAPFCVGSPANRCDFNQDSTPTVNPHTGALYVSFLNGNTPDEDQFLVVRSTDGGNTFEGPFFATPIFDLNFPFGLTRPDCVARGQGATRQVLTNSCFRAPVFGNMVVDRRDGDFADDLYLVIPDNRNGNPASSNSDVFFFKSTDGGETWLGPSRVNNDRSVPDPARRDCGRPEGSLPSGDVVAACGGVGNFGNDQWWPWVDVTSGGDLNVVFFDRRLDAESVRHEWPTSRSRPGNYLVWFFGAVCRVTRTATIPPGATQIPAAASGCLAREAEIIRQPTGPVNPPRGVPVPGQNQTELPFRNFQVSDVPSNFDYSFRAGIFAGDYNNVGIADNDNTAYGFWTDARNGRSSGGPGGVPGGGPSQPGRNPLCEQSDVFLEKWNARQGGREPRLDPDDNLFLVTPCPEAATEEKSNDDG